MSQCRAEVARLKREKEEVTLSFLLQVQIHVEMCNSSLK
jgi:hypothetical protein